MFRQPIAEVQDTQQGHGDVGTRWVSPNDIYEYYTSILTA